MNYLVNILSLDHVQIGVNVSSKKRVFEYVGLMFEQSDNVARAEVSDNLFARERLGSTGLGHGVAIPHGRIKGISKPLAAVLHLKQAIAFDASDEVPVDLLLFLLVPESATQEHLAILSQMAEMLSTADFRESLRSASTPQELYNLIMGWCPPQPLENNDSKGDDGDCNNDFDVTVF